ncbi:MULTISPECIES: PaaI family thioesterase [unclassified Sphingomonas]|uniref:PaaI family thioesterase n=1 Tax=unclassified Sphingomonas TaxID=196159 RepID=UPI001F5996F5|nr:MULTISPECIES: PaaI family thioesterase [unclassified Sphingomonas]
MGFDIQRFLSGRLSGHAGVLGIGYHAQGPGWLELSLPYDARLVGDPARGVIASGAIVTLMDMATSLSVWVKRDRFTPQATLDLRVDYLRPATPGRTVIGRGECLRLTRSIAFVRGQAHDGDPDDPLAHVAGTFMLLDA